ncbi:Postreplication repair E3 ubiquitin-protein ligase rad18 like [Verticillium longisporum]|nr:Postreplication repair E3 ubiquitin-protein ligase rad18 like [Verticillium longisporum]
MTDDFADVPDSTDWLSTPLDGLAPVEAALRCQVCKDFYKTPMLTSCSHTFCSLCIRHALANDGRCPLCRNTDQELKLRNNWALDEIVGAFQNARAKTLEFARKPPPQQPQPARTRASSPKRKREKKDGDVAAPEPKRLRSSARLSGSSSAARSQEPPTPSREVYQIPDSEDDDEGGGDDGDEMYEPEDGLVPCPMCQARMKEEQVFAHLDKCPGPSAAETGSAGPGREGGGGGGSPAAPSALPYDQRARQPGAKVLDRLPSLNYSILKDQALRKKMADLGLSTGGSRQMIEKRHREWITIWNANCDSLRPKRRSELIHDLEVWERTQSGRPSALGRGRAGAMATAVKDKEFDGAAWATKHDNEFKDLIANARKSRSQAQTKKEPDDTAGKSAEIVGADGDKGSEPEGHARENSTAPPDFVPQPDLNGEIIMTEASTADEGSEVQEAELEAEEDNPRTTKTETISGPLKPTSPHLMQDGFDETPLS